MTMNRTIMAICAIALAYTASATFPAQAKAASAPYPKMAPIAQYMMSDRTAEIAFARSAAPASLSKDATVLVLGPREYETAIKGTNGFTCLVERSFTKAFDDDQFWNSRVRTPVCYNPPASRTVLPYTFFETKLALAGATEAMIRDRLTTAVANKRLPPQKMVRWPT